MCRLVEPPNFSLQLNIDGHHKLMHEKCNFMRRFTPRFPIFDTSVTHRVAVKNRQKNAIFCTFPFATQRISPVPQIGEDEILHKKSHISYIDQFVVPPIFEYSIGAHSTGHSSIVCGIFSNRQSKDRRLRQQLGRCPCRIRYATNKQPE